MDENVVNGAYCTGSIMPVDGAVVIVCCRACAHRGPGKQCFQEYVVQNDSIWKCLKRVMVSVFVDRGRVSISTEVFPKPEK